MERRVCFRPLEKWPRKFTQERRGDSFQVVFNKTIALLEKEVELLGADSFVVQLALQEAEIRRDGWPRANSVPRHPGVLLSFQSVHGPLTFACDAFYTWQANLRGIGLTLERLRLADLYGVTKGGEQYKGWRAIEAAPATDPLMDAAGLLVRYGECAIMPIDVVQNVEMFKRAYREASAKTHPDNGGNIEHFKEVQAVARILLEVHGKK